jgi:hypothetical protein
MAGGYRSAMKPTLAPNGGRRFKQSPSCKRRVAPLGNSLSKLEDSVRIFTLDMSGVPPAMVDQLHANKLVRAPKGAEPEGRVCVHGSGRSSAEAMSLNKDAACEMEDLAQPDRNPHLRCDLTNDARRVRGFKLDGEPTSEVDRVGYRTPFIRY